MMRATFAVAIVAALGAGAAVAQNPQSFEVQPAPDGPVSVASADAAVAEAAVLAPPERLAGVRTYSEPVAFYPETDFSRIGAAVGRLTAEQPIEILGQVPRNSYCTAWLVDRSRILTARHCIEGGVGAVPKGNMRVELGYGWSSSPSRDYRLGRIVAANDRLDFALIELVVPAGQPLPGDAHGVIRLAASLPSERPLFVVHHPFGFQQLLIKDNTCRQHDVGEGQDWQFFHRCDTRSASSGAPILTYIKGRAPGSVDREVPVAVALHTAGQELLNDNSVNLATSTAAIVEALPELQPLACRRDPGSWRCPSLLRPDGRSHAYEFARGWALVQTQSDGLGGFVPELAFTSFSAGVRADVPASGYFVVRVVGDASLDDVPPHISGIENREKVRQSIAYWRASSVVGMLISNGYLPPAAPAALGPGPMNRFYHVEPEIRQGPDAGHGRSVEVFIE